MNYKVKLLSYCYHDTHIIFELINIVFYFHLVVSLQNFSPFFNCVKCFSLHLFTAPLPQGQHAVKTFHLFTFGMLSGKSSSCYDMFTKPLLNMKPTKFTVHRMFFHPAFPCKHAL